MQADQEAAAARDQKDAEQRSQKRKETAEKRDKDRKEQAERRARERKDRDEMMGEREANRLRKLKGSGREWDMGKEEQEASAPPTTSSPRGGEERTRGPGRGARGGGGGRGGFEGRGSARGRGRGRGEQRDLMTPAKDEKTPLLGQTDFPELPKSSAPAEKEDTPRKELTFPAQTAKALGQTSAGKTGKREEETKDNGLGAADALAGSEIVSLEPIPKGEKKAWADMDDD